MSGFFCVAVCLAIRSHPTGLPFPAYFPFDTLEASVAKSARLVPPLAAEFHSLSPTAASSLLSRFSFDEQTPPVPDTNDSPIHVSIPKYSPPAVGPGNLIDVATALQYTDMNGLAPLASFINDFALNHLHGGRIPYSNPGILLTCGNTDGLGKAISLLGERGDNMLVEDFTYPNSIQTAAPYGIGIVPIGMDVEGIRSDGPGGLRDILEHWDSRVQGRRPHLMYTVTVGQNPTGSTLSLARRRAIYALCERFDIIIIEDDPYWYLQFTSTPFSSTPRPGKYPFLESLTPSFMTLDTAGRVIRLDTFSKTIAPGCRLGWITAQPEFITRLTDITSSSTYAPSGFSQAFVITLLHNWGMSGWVDWLAALRDVYALRKDNMCVALAKHASTPTTHDDDADDAVVVATKPMYEFVSPDGGMFVWVRVRIEEHPAYKSFTRSRTKLEMMTALWGFVADTQLALPCPGWIFAASERIKQREAAEMMRFCFAAVEEVEVGEATERWGRGVQVFWGMSEGDIVAWLEGKKEKGDVAEGVVGVGWANREY